MENLSLNATEMGMLDGMLADYVLTDPDDAGDFEIRMQCGGCSGTCLQTCATSCEGLCVTSCIGNCAGTCAGTG
jgi:hypothetical protein